MQGDVAHNMYPIPAVYQRIFNQLIQILNWLVDGDFLSILVKTEWYFYCKRLQNDSTLNFVHFSGPFCMLVYSCFSFSFFCCALFYFSYLSVQSEKRFWFSHSKSTGNNTAASATKRPRHTSTACTLNVAECPSRSAAGKQINSKTKARLTGGHHLNGGMLPPLLLKPLLLATEQTSFVPRLCWATLLRILLNKAVYSWN